MFFYDHKNFLIRKFLLFEKKNKIYYYRSSNYRFAIKEIKIFEKRIRK